MAQASGGQDQDLVKAAGGVADDQGLTRVVFLAVGDGQA